MHRILAAATLAALTASASAAGLDGVWLRADTGGSKVRFAPCGGVKECGTIIWLKDPKSPAHVGQRVFYDMVPNGAGSWSGSAFNPDDGRTYTGKMSLSGDTLTTAGCILGGLICKSVTWTRSH
ncbi:MAG: DUF2147 domain-containing protein [Hyphomicrobiales bacterium]|nr:DUF2147 domain-containing protein [Hyphomicrobiales bacterium]MDE2017750.1 DUF2147 domain-containing protein [Hyphomicrobiales bacterium]